MDALKCPVCGSSQFMLRYEARYVYSYCIDSNAPGLKNDEEFLPFLFDGREQKEARQYIECDTCCSKYPCYFNQWDKSIGIRYLQDALRPENRI